MIIQAAYDAQSVLREVDDQTVLVMALAVGALTGNVIFWGDQLRRGFRERVYPMPIPCMFFFIAHDGTFLASYDKWFNEIDHWFPKLWWCGLVVTFAMELVFLSLFLRYGREEHTPHLSQRAFVALTFAGLAATFAPWLAIKDVMDDELYLTIFGFTVFWCVPWYLALMWRRQAPGGQSFEGWLAFQLMPLFAWPMSMVLSDEFRTAPWIALGVVTVAGGAVNAYYVRTLSKYPGSDPKRRSPWKAQRLPTPAPSSD